MNCFVKKHCNEMSLRLIRTSVIHNDNTTLRTKKRFTIQTKYPDSKSDKQNDYLLVQPEWWRGRGAGVPSRVLKFIDLGLFNTFMTPNQSPRGRPQNREVLPCLVMFSWKWYKFHTCFSNLSSKQQIQIRVVFRL